MEFDRQSNQSNWSVSKNQFSIFYLMLNSILTQTNNGLRLTCYSDENQANQLIWMQHDDDDDDVTLKSQNCHFELTLYELTVHELKICLIFAKCN